MADSCRAQGNPDCAVTDLSNLIRRLEDWKEYDFQSDYQLSDEILIADGWRCEPNPEFEGGVCWYFGTNPQYSTSENQRPRLILDLNTALGVVPIKYSVCLTITDGEARSSVWLPGDAVRHEGRSSIPTVAILIAALKAKRVIG